MHNLEGEQRHLKYNIMSKYTFQNVAIHINFAKETLIKSLK